MHSLYYRYLRSDKQDFQSSHRFASELLDEIQDRVKVDLFFQKFVHIYIPEKDSKSVLFSPPLPTVDCDVECCQTLIETYRENCGFTDYSLQYTRVFTNVCSKRHMMNMLDAVSHFVNTVKTMCLQK